MKPFRDLAHARLKINAGCALPLAFPKSSILEEKMAEEKAAGIPTLFVCHGDQGGPKMHPCRRVQESLQAKGIEYEKVIAGHGNPIPFLRKGSREELKGATGDKKLPALKLSDGTVITHSKAILGWVDQQP